ncbi:hypothetical protein Sjap_001177 [Stephania japonica]|uniref:Uncharacterized protein n=1 Tax=Stephania japonica TaxID=461633 RepID=A0AAP0PRF3_9MAGN
MAHSLIHFPMLPNCPWSKICRESQVVNFIWQPDRLGTLRCIFALCSQHSFIIDISEKIGETPQSTRWRVILHGATNDVISRAYYLDVLCHTMGINPRQHHPRRDVSCLTVKVP